jgi:hypothetical protein
VKEGIFKDLLELIRHLANLEFTSTAGRINILGMILSLILAISLSLAPIFETLIQLVHPNVSVGAPLLPLFIIFCIFTTICALMIGYLEGPRSNRARNASSEGGQGSSDNGTTKQ